MDCNDTEIKTISKSLLRDPHDLQLFVFKHKIICECPDRASQIIFTQL